MQRLNSHLHTKKQPPYVLNLDPAVLKVPFGTNIDIRDSVNYKKVMEDYNLGPNGAIMTSLNLFATKIDQVLGIVEKRAPKLDHVIVDTPGQIECFIWSASGAIITDAFASAFPTMIAYIVDTPRTTSPATFMSNMLYACSILYKTKLPMIIVFNKIDAQDPEFAKEWMSDFEKFQEALRNDEDLNGEGENSSGYMGSLMNSLSLMLEEFYCHLDVAAVSAYTGEGFDEFLESVQKKVDEYNKDYKAERDAIIKKREEDAAARKAQDLTKLMKDIGIQDDKAKPTDPAKEPIDSISDTEDIEPNELDGEVERDEDEGIIGQPSREYTLDPDDVGAHMTDSSLQDRYQQALAASGAEADREAMQKIINSGLQ
ncbi:GTPase NPA3 [Sugiyamaella lignohabitans]|uniref:GPN-loop GTPase n=1 Tax=Sugiyamaella lignohabitans TaxID=796027 RepID=A0A167ENV4_9ASCO|nr:GTPase NPA3 [Sugiyamaella lignohabitans]ANB14294.1 GTPase NPA3 [Sugiyamaella lignohabitans]